MKLSVTAHWHLIPRGQRKRALQRLAAIDPKYVRVSSLQREVLDGNAVRELLGMGFRVIPVINGEKSGMMSDKAWREYVAKAASLMPKLGSRQVWVVQVLNEPNTARFWGSAPDARAALVRFKVAADILRQKHQCILITPGLTNEGKSDGKTKMAARKFLEVWVGEGAPADFWALHVYEAEWKKGARIFTGNVKFLMDNDKVPTVTETGGSAAWYAKVADADGLEGVPAGMVAWYCFNGHPGYDLVDGNLTGGDVYAAMKEDSE